MNNTFRFLASPTPTQQSILASIPRVEYFPARFSQFWDLDNTTIDQLTHSKYNLIDRFYFDTIEKPLGEHIAHQFPKNSVLLRGATCSIENSITTSKLSVKTISQVLRDGSEQNKIHIALTPFGLDTRQISSLTTLWLKKSARLLREKIGQNTQQAKSIYPVLLVYDATKLQKSSATYHYRLPLGQCSELILKAYVTDYPLIIPA